jgi:hypothetical protein
MFRFKEDVFGGGSQTAHIDCRDAVELIRLRAESAFSGKRLAMIELYYGCGATCRQIGALIGRSEGHTYRMLISMVKRLNDDQCVYFLRNRSKFTTLEQKFLEANLFEGCGLKKIALRFNCSVYRVRKAVERLGLLSKLEKANQKGGAKWK